MSEAIDELTFRRAVAGAQSWADLMRRLGHPENGGRRRALRQRVQQLGLSTAHFRRKPDGRTYSDEQLLRVAARSRTLREVALALGTTPATGTLSHLRRRLEAAGADLSHFRGIGRASEPLPLSDEELCRAAAQSSSVSETAHRLGVPDDGKHRAAVGRLLRQRQVPTGHFHHSPYPPVPEEELRTVVAGADSWAGVMRTLGLPVNDTHHRRLRRQAKRLGLDTTHFRRRSWATAEADPDRGSRPADVLRLRTHGTTRVNRDRLHRALEASEVPYRCADCGNTGSWQGRPLTLQIDHIDGNWLDNRQENLRYLCPNCHALTPTWCRKKNDRTTGRGPVGTAAV